MIYNNNEVIIINFVLLLSEFCCNFISSALIEWFCEGVDELTALLQLVFNCKKSVWELTPRAESPRRSPPRT